MPTPAYIVELRAKIGQALLLLPAAAAIVQDDEGYTHITFPNGDEAHFVSSTFVCRVVGGNLRPDGDKSLEVVYFAADALPEGVVCDHEIRIRDALVGQEAAFFR